MNHSEPLLAAIRGRANEIDRRAQLMGPIVSALGEAPAPVQPEPLTVRLGVAADWPALRHLAELDSATAPPAPLLIGERNGRLLAALSLENGAVVANPFAPTADVVALLELRARQLGREGRPGRAIAWRLLRAGG
jgi:hypothetical protein